MPVPDFRADGYLPEGLYRLTEAEFTFRFGGPSRRRRRLILRARRWIDLARQIGAVRLLIDGSFVTAKDDTGDIDSVVLLPANFQQQIDSGIEAAVELEQMLLTRQPEEIFAAEDEEDSCGSSSLVAHANGTVDEKDLWRFNYDSKRKRVSKS